MPNQFDDIDHGTHAIVMGWGYNTTYGAIQTTLQESQVIIFSDEECTRRHIGQYFKPYEANICAGLLEGGRGACDVSIVTNFTLKLFVFICFFF